MLGFGALSTAPFSNTTGSNVNSAVILSLGSLNSSIGNLTFSADAALATTLSASMSSSLGTLEIKVAASIEISNLLATSSASSLSFIAEASRAITGTSSASSVNSLNFTADALKTITGISADLVASTLDFNAEADITTTSVNSTLTIVDISTFIEADAEVTLDTVSGIFQTNLPVPNDNLFNYDAHADDYNRTRTVYVLAEGGYGLSKVAHINPENFTLILDAYKGTNNKVVHVHPENFTLVIDKHKDIPNTVLITQ
tara:strand:- start:2770 stop:3540 length:771 start_codon:yes stop_codon:yes gene_type:complete